MGAVVVRALPLPSHTTGLGVDGVAGVTRLMQSAQARLLLPSQGHGRLADGGVIARPPPC